MQEQAIIDGNKLIAEFMGARWEFQAEIYHSYGWRFENHRPTKWASLWHNTEGLQYYSSWDWLMPVVEKITNVLNYSVELSNLGANNWRFAIYSGGCLVCQSRLLETPIEATWSAVVEFIKWYDLCQK